MRSVAVAERSPTLFNIFDKPEHIAPPERRVRFFDNDFAVSESGAYVLTVCVGGERPFGGKSLQGGEGKFSGKDWDPDASLYYFNARWYDPDLGRFTTEDPALDGLNWYAYCGNNPLRFMDPTGLRTGDEEDDESVITFTPSDNVTSGNEVGNPAPSNYQASVEQMTNQDYGLDYIRIAEEEEAKGNLENAAFYRKLAGMENVNDVLQSIYSAIGGANEIAMVERAFDLLQPFLDKTRQGGLEPNVKGMIGVARAEEIFKEVGGTIRASKAVAIDFNGTRIIADRVGQRNGEWYVIEVKYGPGANLTKNQDIVFNSPAPHIGVPVGPNASDVGLNVGKETTFKICIIFIEFQED